MIINTCIVIPCFNEQNRIKTEVYISFLKQHSNVLICFVNDASTDSTVNTLENIQQSCKEQVVILNNATNSGKAISVKAGMHYCHSNLDYQYIGYLDADLSTSLEEFFELSNEINEKTTFVFGSRILKIGSNIKRKKSRFLIGRVVATIISNILQLKVYDTQCGCKIFTRDLAEVAFAKPFISKWLFDVEIFDRILKHYGREHAEIRMLEVPLKQWIDVDESSVKFSYFFKIWIDLIRIYRIVRTNENGKQNQG